MKRILFLATTTGYQTRMFGEAAERLGVKLVFATDRCDQLEDPWWDGAIPIRFHQEAAAVEAIAEASRAARFDGVLPVGDRPTVIAAYAARLLGLPGHPPEAAHAARDKRLTRESLRHAGLNVPSVTVVSRTADPEAVASRLAWPVVVKPAALSGSRGVMRADNHTQFIDAFQRLQRLLASTDVRVLQDPAADTILIEQFIDGHEYALEGVLENGELRTLAIFDKPDPLDGPFFEETIYVTPSRADETVQAAIRQAASDAAAALGLFHGPVHAECRVNARGVFVLEVAARPIGGLCAQALTFIPADGGEGAEGTEVLGHRSAGVHRRTLAPPHLRVGLEELLLRHALGESMAGWTREPDASGVMMIPIPAAGVYRRVTGVEEASAVSGVRGVHITAKPDQQLIPLPEGSSYLGFIFARAKSPAAVEEALREAHARLSFEIDRPIVVAQGA